MTESEWQERIRRHLNRPSSGIRVWRQNAGKFQVSDRLGKRWINGAPKGAADLVGLIHGVHLEVECKVKARWTRCQQRWADMVHEHGGIYVLATWVEGRSVEENLAMVEDRVREAWRHAA